MGLINLITFFVAFNVSFMYQLEYYLTFFYISLEYLLIAYFCYYSQNIPEITQNKKKKNMSQVSTFPRLLQNWSRHIQFNPARHTKTTPNHIIMIWYFCVCITGSMKNAPTAAMDVILDLTLFHQIVDRAAKSAMLRMSREGIGSGKCIWMREDQSLLELAPLLNLPSVGMTRKFIVAKKISTGLCNKREWDLRHYHSQGR